MEMGELDVARQNVYVHAILKDRQTEIIPEFNVAVGRPISLSLSLSLSFSLVEHSTSVGMFVMKFRKSAWERRSNRTDEYIFYVQSRSSPSRN